MSSTWYVIVSSTLKMGFGNSSKQSGYTRFDLVYSFLIMYCSSFLVLFPQMLDSNDAMLQAIVECQSAGRLEDALILIRTLEESITNLLTHYEIYTAGVPHPESYRSTELRNIRDARVVKRNTIRRPTRANKTVLPREASAFMERQDERARTLLVHRVYPASLSNSVLTLIIFVCFCSSIFFHLSFFRRSSCKYNRQVRRSFDGKIT